ncbi:MAG: dTMP kinase [Candidatus Omnitrophota bacterium]|nr:dTMP kinase [Candidatus Omnitrophota bacterium]
MKGLFVTFEGAEGSGKSTQIKLLEEYLKKKGARVLVLREPGSTKFSEDLRRVLLDKRNGFLSEKTELLLYLAARAQLVKEKIIPALKEKKIVLCDRFQDSTLVYQGYGLGLDRKVIELLGGFVSQGARPDLTFLLDIPAEKGLKRAGGASDRIQERPLAYHRRVRNGYLRLASENPKRIKVIKAKDIQNTQEEIRKLIQEFLLKHL